MAVVGLPPAFIPPVVAVPAANAIVPLVAGAAATGVSLPVLPLLSAVVVGAAVASLAALAIAALLQGRRGPQQWGWVNGRKAADPEDAQTWGPFPGDLRPVSVCVVSTDGGSYANCLQTNLTTLDRIGVRQVPWQPNPEKVQYIATVTPPDGEAYDVCVARGVIDGRCLEFPRQGYGPRVSVLEPSGWQVQPASPPYTPQPVPETEPERLVPPRPVVVPPAPLPAPAQPERSVPAPVAPPQPGTAPSPGQTPAQPRRLPATRPSSPPAPSPLPISTPQPQGSPIQTDGTQAPAPKLPPAKTPTDAHIVNGSPVRSPGPAPTPEGIAKEVGRIEEKLASLMDPKRAPDGDSTDRLGLLFQLAQQIFEFLTSVTASGEYTLSSPCVLDENDQRIVQSVQYGGALGPIGLVSNKVDALAELIQVHKDLKQPICRQTPAVGQPVTVNFVQTD